MPVGSMLFTGGENGRCRRDRFLVLRLWRCSIGRAQVAAVPVERPGQGVAEIAQKVPVIGDLHCGRCAATDAVGVGARAVARDNLDAGVALEPGCDGLGVAVGQEVNGAGPRPCS